MNITYFTNVRDTWASVLKDLRNAKESIHIEQYILSDFEEGRIGQEITDILIEKASQGLKVEILLDFFGSIKVFSPEKLFTLGRSGVNIHFTDIKFKHFVKYLPWETKRNHRKLTIIDKKIVYVGGVVFLERVKDWLDFHARFETDAQRFVKSFALSKYDKSDRTIYLDSHDPFQILINGFVKKNITREIKRSIRNADEHITIITPYFSPSKKIIRSLKRKVEEGVTVSIYIPQKVDSPFAKFSHIYWAQKLKDTKISLKVNDGRMNHAKIIHIDNWLTFGSCNFDLLSLYYNKELNLQTRDMGEIKKIEKLYQDHFLKNATCADEVLLTHGIKNKWRVFLGSLTRVIT